MMYELLTRRDSWSGEEKKPKTGRPTLMDVDILQRSHWTLSGERSRVCKGKRRGQDKWGGKNEGTGHQFLGTQWTKDGCAGKNGMSVKGEGSRKKWEVEQINLQRTKVYVFSDSVVCLGKIHENLQSNDAWKQRLGWFKSSPEYRNFDRIDGEPMDFEWNISQDSISDSSVTKSKVYC